MADDEGMKKLIVGIALLAVSSPAHAEDADHAEGPKKHFVSALVGSATSISEPSSGTTHLTYGARAGMAAFTQPSGTLFLGLALQTLGTSAKVSSVSLSSRLTTIMAEGITRRAFGSGLYIGGRFGLSVSSLNISSSTTDLSSSGATYAVGPVAGYEIDVAKAVSVGLDVNWTVIGGTTFKFANGSQIETGSNGAIFVQGGVNYHF